MRYHYTYKGPVMEFDRIICNDWSGDTIASTEKQAKLFLTHQFKVNNNRLPNARITLPGKVKKLEAVM